jgi:hypothetical protein
MSSQTSDGTEFKLIQTRGSRHNYDEILSAGSLEELRELLDAQTGGER